MLMQKGQFIAERHVPLSFILGIAASAAKATAPVQAQSTPTLRQLAQQARIIQDYGIPVAAPKRRVQFPAKAAMTEFAGVTVDRKRRAKAAVAMVLEGADPGSGRKDNPKPQPKERQEAPDPRPMPALPAHLREKFRVDMNRKSGPVLYYMLDGTKTDRKLRDKEQNPTKSSYRNGGRKTHSMRNARQMCFRNLFSLEEMNELVAVECGDQFVLCVDDGVLN